MLFQREPVSVIINEGSRLMLENAAETTRFKDIKFEPNFEKYLELDKAGAFKSFTVRDDNGLLIGYAIFLVSQNLQYMSSYQALQDVIFIRQESRGDGWQFIKWIDEQLAMDGVQVVYQSVKSDHNWGAILERQGYELVDLVYGKRLNTWE
jgi:hypothetical protein